MKIGLVGLGKLGLPVGVAMALRGHDVMGFDLDPQRMTHAPQPYRETGPDGTGNFNDWLAKSTIRFGSLAEVVAHGEIVFIAVQTPHNPLYEGITRLPASRMDFDYGYLIEAVKAVTNHIGKTGVVAIISTVLPGTCRREIAPLVPPNVALVYNPSFIAMGTTMRDFLNPEFVLVGSDDAEAMEIMAEFYGDLYAADSRRKGMRLAEAVVKNLPGDIPAMPRITRLSIESAELTKVAYNTFISQKIGFANTIMEICESIPGADCDEVIDALSLATQRVISPAYLRGGMGDGGGCHPRDNIAMSWLAQRLELSHDIFSDAMQCREDQTQWLADIVVAAADRYRLPVAIMGVAYKPGTNLTVGSAALLLTCMLREAGIKHRIIDPHVYEPETLHEPVIALIGCNHDEWIDYQFPKGSVVIDPWRYMPDRDGVIVLRIGGDQRCRIVLQFFNTMLNFGPNRIAARHAVPETETED